MLSPKISRWLGALILLMLALRFGNKYYRRQQRPTYETRLEETQARQQKLTEAIRADQDAQRARGATVVVADSTALAADSAHAAP